MYKSKKERICCLLDHLYEQILINLNFDILSEYFQTLMNILVPNSGQFSMTFHLSLESVALTVAAIHFTRTC